MRRNKMHARFGKAYQRGWLGPRPELVRLRTLKAAGILAACAPSIRRAVVAAQEFQSAMDRVAATSTNTVAILEQARAQIETSKTQRSRLHAFIREDTNR